MEKFVVIPNFQADKEIIDLSTAFDVKFEKDVLNFVSASRLTELKGIMRSLRVLKKLKDEGYQFVWHILGDGEQKEEIKNYIKENNMESCVILHGLQKNPYPFIKAADFLYLGSYHESYGLVLIESMLLGRPVLTTKTISAEEIVDKSYGWVCDNTEDGIYDGFKSIFENVKAVETKTQNLIGYTFNNQAIKEKYKELFRS